MRNTPIALLLTVILLVSLFLSGCSNPSSSTASTHTQGEYIYRKHDEKLIEIEPMLPANRNPYPWETIGQG